MKTISALFGSALAAIVTLLAALMFGGCARNTPSPAAEERIPVIPTTMVYSVEAPSGMDRNAIAFPPHKPGKPETFVIHGKSQTISLEQAFVDIENDTFDIFNAADLALDAELTNGISPDEPNNDISVLKAVACHAIEGHEPQDETTIFSAQDRHACVFTQVALPTAYSGRIWHVWKHEGVTKLQVELLVEGPTYRTGSRKSLDCNQVGHWTVEVTTDNGDVLEQVELEVI